MADENHVDEKAALKENYDHVKNDGSAVIGDSDIEHDSPKAKFINGSAANETDPEVAFVKGKSDSDFCGLTKEELEKYANDPFWVKVRWILLILFWLIWFGMLVAAIVIIVVSPKCPPRPNLDWWQKSVVYKVYPRSYKDTNGDGIGDLKGINEKLDYIQNYLKASTIYMYSPYTSLNDPFAITNFKEINPEYGTMEDFDNLRIALHKRNMKLVLDFSPGFTSVNHTWFVNSRANSSADNQFRGYYIWRDGSGSNPPNNWLSKYGGSAWEKDAASGQFYLHTFLKSQPNLNLRNSDVQAYMNSTVEFWLNKGVDGFVVSSADTLFASTSSDDEPAASSPTTGYDSLDHTLTAFQPETFTILNSWKSILNKIEEKTDKPRALFAESSIVSNKTSEFYKNGISLVLNPALFKLKSECDGNCIHNLVKNGVASTPEGSWFNWQTGSPDVSRIATRLAAPSMVSFVNAVNMLNLFLPGTSFVYYGEEIAMTDNNNISWAQTRDELAILAGPNGYQAVSRDPQRTPMQWSPRNMSDFTTAATTWLPINQNYRTINLMSQRASGAGHTNVEVFAEYTALRENPSFQWGKLHYSQIDANIFSFIRQAERFPGYLVAINFGKIPFTADFVANSEGRVPKEGKIETTTANFKDHLRANDFKIGRVMDLSKLILHPGEGVVFSWTTE